MTAATSSAGPAPAAVAWEGGELVLVRAFDAPRELVFRAWTEPERFARWWGPAGSSLPFCTLDARPGGTLHFCHRFPDHPDVWVRGEFREAAAPERVAFTCWFSDPEGGRAERPGFPAEMTIVVTLDERDGGTLLTARHAGLAEDRGEVQGWTESLDRLAGLLAAHPTTHGEDR
ncbi:MAG TPA: SRPBCC domain-containing protein [Longimicrobiaceae bacterium]|jgi:uncharacterized protein YndB with AHSA1/START domain